MSADDDDATAAAKHDDGDDEPRRSIGIEFACKGSLRDGGTRKRGREKDSWASKSRREVETFPGKAAGVLLHDFYATTCSCFVARPANW